MCQIIKYKYKRGISIISFQVCTMREVIMLTQNFTHLDSSAELQNKFLAFYPTQMFTYRAHNRPPLDPTRTQMAPVPHPHILFSVSSILILALPSTPLSVKCSHSFRFFPDRNFLSLHISSVPRLRHVPPTSPSLTDHLNYI